MTESSTRSGWRKKGQAGSRKAESVIILSVIVQAGEDEESRVKNSGVIRSRLGEMSHKENCEEKNKTQG